MLGGRLADDLGFCVLGVAAEGDFGLAMAAFSLNSSRYERIADHRRRADSRLIELPMEGLG